MPFANCNDLRIYYEIRGSGPRLLYIGGTGGDLRRPPHAFSNGYQNQFETLGYDQRGLGQTGKPDELYSMAQYADDAAQLLDAVGWEQCHVIGYSFGGMVAQELALRHPDRVTKLVIAGSTSGGRGGSSFPMERFAAMPVDEMLPLRISKMDTRRDANWQLANPAEYKKLCVLALEAMRFGAEEPGKETGARRQLEARAKMDTFERLPQLRIPVLVCGGTYDGIAEPAAVKAMAAAIPGAKVMFFPDGHFFLHQIPDATKTIIGFLSGP